VVVAGDIVVGAVGPDAFAVADVLSLAGGLVQDGAFDVVFDGECSATGIYVLLKVKKVHIVRYWWYRELSMIKISIEV